MNHPPSPFTLPDLYPTRVFSFGSPKQEQTRQGELEGKQEIESIENENILLKKHNEFLMRENQRLEDENRNLKGAIYYQRSKSQTSRVYGSGRETPKSQREKDKGGLRTLEVSESSLIPEDMLQEHLMIISSKNRTISKLEKKLRVLEEVNKYQLEMVEQEYKERVQEKEEQIKEMRNAWVLRDPKENNLGVSEPQSVPNVQDLQGQNRRLKNKINRLREESIKINQSKVELEEMVYELYYQVETYSKESEAIQSTRNYFENLRIVFDKRSTKGNKREK